MSQEFWAIISAEPHLASKVRYMAFAMTNELRSHREMVKNGNYSGATDKTKTEKNPLHLMQNVSGETFDAVTG